MAKVNIEGVKIVIGLGNPGKKYEKTYHNTGFLAVDFLIKNISVSSGLSKFRIPSSKNFGYVKIGKLVLIKPLTFMNNSGKAVKEAIRYFSAKPEEVLIIHDDSDINLGKCKVSFGRGSAGHQGVESIVKFLHTKNFQRLRVGVKQTGKKAEEIVLKKIGKNDLKIIEKVFKTINIKDHDKC